MVILVKMEVSEKKLVELTVSLVENTVTSTLMAKNANLLTFLDCLVILLMKKMQELNLKRTTL